MTEKKKPFSFVLQTDGKQLKVLATLFMSAYSFATVVIMNGYLKYYTYSQEQITQLLENDEHFITVSSWATGLQLMVGIALPIYAFLLVEGVRNTSDLKKYGIRIGLLALVSEIPFDLAFSHQLFDFSSQNGAISLFICLMMLAGYRFTDHTQKAANIGFKLVITLSAIAWTLLVRSMFGLSLVLLTACYWLLYDHKIAKNIVGALIGCLNFTGPLALYVLYGYNGNRGKVRNRYFYYLYYPLHLLLLSAIAYLLIR